VYSCFTSKLEPSFTLQPSASRSLKMQVRITKKILTAHGVWQFITMQRVNTRYVWDKRKVQLQYRMVGWPKALPSTGGTNTNSSNRSSTTIRGCGSEWHRDHSG